MRQWKGMGVFEDLFLKKLLKKNKLWLVGNVMLVGRGYKNAVMKV